MQFGKGLIARLACRCAGFFQFGFEASSRIGMIVLLFVLRIFSLGLERLECLPFPLGFFERTEFGFANDAIELLVPLGQKIVDLTFVFRGDLGGPLPKISLERLGLLRKHHRIDCKGIG